MTPQELAAIRRRHGENKAATLGSTPRRKGEPERCYFCDEPMPCAVVRLLARIEELEKVVAAAREAKQAVLKWANTCDHIGCECDNTLADELPDDWMAVAALEEGE